MNRPTRWLEAVAALALVVATGQSRDPSLAAAISSLEKVAADLAKSGRAADTEETLQILAELGMDPKAREKLAATCRQEAAKVKKPAAAPPTAVASIQKVAKDLGSRLASASDPDRASLARRILRLDDRVSEAHAALGQELVDGEWLDAAGKARHARNDIIETAVTKARQLDLKLELSPSHHPDLAGVRSTAPSTAKYGRVEFHSVWPEEKLRRVVLATLRCSALIHFLAMDRLEVPVFEPRTYVLFDDTVEFQAAVRRGAQNGRVDPLVADMIEKIDTAYLGKEELITFQPFEGHCASVLLGDLMSGVQWKSDRASVDFHGLEPWIAAGLTNWSTLSLLGERLPVYVVGEDDESRSRSRNTSALSAEEMLYRKRMLRLSEAGISGGRAWLEYLARRGEEPSLSGSFRDQMGRIQGDDLLKSTFVVEMLSQEGPLLPLLVRLQKTSTPEAATHAFEAARKQPLVDFERDWRASFLPALPGLAQRLGTGAEARVPEGDQQVLELLNAMRVKAGAKNGPIDLDLATSEACGKHARYLAQHPEQQDKWPDAHEEYADRAGFDPRGAWAGAHSVVASGVKSPRDALSAWMATYYHRLPLLDPNLVRIGLGFEKGCAVLDCRSFVKPVENWVTETKIIDSNDPTIWGTVWPPPKGVDIPTRFAAEVPEPVPGVSSATLGYPVTLQLRSAGFYEIYDIVLTLHLGGASGAAVDCYVSTPFAPTNPNVPVRLAWCLMPKAPLQAGATYTVAGRVRSSKEDRNFEIEWSFRCGK
jgi:uncharacterized protein YkwD